MLDEHEANQALINTYSSSLNASNIYADIHRNSYLKSVRGAPEEITPDKDMHFPPGLKPIAVDELRPGYINPAAKISISAQASGKSDNKESVREAD